MKALREGFTTGSCAAAAALACCLRQTAGECPERVEILLPDGRRFAPRVISHEDGSCGVRKDSGDDPDITDGVEVVARVEPEADEGPVRFFAGEGVGIVTQPGLKLPAGEAAVNPVPRRMIEEAVRSVWGIRGARVTLSIPGGRELARRTFNPRLGIEGGLSILGTSGVVRPMSEEALKDALYEELKMRRAQGWETLVFTFGNQGEKAMRRLYPDLPAVQMSNEVGFMLDAARELGVRRIILGGHPGKLCKVAAGVMQTHSRTADGRREAVITQLALEGAPLSMLREIYACRTMDHAAQAIAQAGFGRVWARLGEAAWRYCRLRTLEEVAFEVVFTDASGAVLGRYPEEEA